MAFAASVGQSASVSAGLGIGFDSGEVVHEVVSRLPGELVDSLVYLR
jgi:hypothetical protein